MSQGSSTDPLFGDLLALARRAWIRAMATRLAERGYHDYRVSDALTFRWLIHGPLPFAAFTQVLNVSRQSARKVVDGLVEREFATFQRDAHDARRRTIALTKKGRDYAQAVVDIIHVLNADLAEKIDPELLVAATTVLTYVKDNVSI
jgi:DNA-binding MarR family transcriptional regulator